LYCVNSPQSAVDAVGEREVDDSVDAAERHGWFRAIDGERFEPRTFAAGEDQSQNSTHGAITMAGAKSLVNDDAAGKWNREG
jgi:hypothetical protein